MDLDKLSLSDKIIAGTGIVLIIDLLFLPWHDIPVFDDISAIESPNSFWGVLALILTIAVVAITLLRVFKPETKLPDLPVSWDRATFFGAAATLGVLVLKLILETDFLGFGAWLGLLLAAGMTYGGYLKFQADSAQAGAGTGTA